MEPVPVITSPSPAEVWLRVYVEVLPNVVPGHAAQMAAQAVEQFNSWKKTYEAPK